MSEIIAEMILPAETLQQYVDVFTPLVSEGKIHFNDDGISTTVVDPANVAMILPAHLDAAAFESYDAPGSATIGIDFTTLDERLGPANAGDLVHLAVDMETRKLQIKFRNVEQSIGMIDPDAIRNDPDNPDLDLPNQITVTGADLVDAIDVVGLVSDHIEIDADPDAEVVELIGAGDIDDTTVTFGTDELLEGHVADDTTSLFGHDYLEELTAPVPKDAEVELTFGDEFPMELDWTAADGALTVHQMIAPRIRSE